MCFSLFLASSLLVSAPRAQESIVSFPTGSVVTASDSAFVELSKRYFAWHFGVNPVSATSNGVHEFDGELDDLSSSGIKKRQETATRFLDELSRLEPSDLSSLHRYDYLILRDHIRSKLFSLKELRAWENSPLFYTGLVGGSIRSLLSRDFAPWEVRLKNAISRLTKIPHLLAQAEANLKSPARIDTETAIKQNAGCISLITEDLKKAGQNAPELQESLENASKITVEALESFGDYLEQDLLERSTADYRLGKELYAKKLQHTLNSDIEPEELTAKAWKEYEAVRAEIIQISRKLHGELFGEQAAEEAGKTDEEMAREVYSKIADVHCKPDELLDQCRKYLAELEDFIREKDIITLPAGEKLEMEWTPEFERGVAIAGLESPGPLDRGLKTFFYVAPVPEEWSDEQVESYLREYNNYLLRILCIHEALPGHYVQGAYANRFPSLVRAVLGSGVFIEGWAVYTERMMIAAGYGGGDPRLKLSQLKFYLRTVTNTIIDIGLHTGTMSEEEALELMIHGGFQEESEARGKIVRASLTSTQLVTYFVGLQGVVELEKLYREKVGQDFAPEAFNERLLSFGSPPLSYLKEMVLEEGVSTR
ncbi:MAG: hypothetical protein AMJ46_03850 [Latescibacteria bacterium DG_63]|nr:MAG: hypothetical protein AMJ46_03850 [Latescibacteria bacterium DG_63]